MTSFQILSVDALTLCLACSRRSSSSSPQVTLSAAAGPISPLAFFPRSWSRSRTASCLLVEPEDFWICRPSAQKETYQTLPCWKIVPAP